MCSLFVTDSWPWVFLFLLSCHHFDSRGQKPFPYYADHILQESICWILLANMKAYSRKSVGILLLFERL